MKVRNYSLKSQYLERKNKKNHYSFSRFLLKFQCESLELFNEITISREKNLKKLYFCQDISLKFQYES